MAFNTPMTEQVFDAKKVFGIFMRRKCLLDFMNVTNNLRLRKHIERRGVLARQCVQIDPFKTQIDRLCAGNGDRRLITCSRSWLVILHNRVSHNALCLMFMVKIRILYRDKAKGMPLFFIKIINCL